MNLRCTICDEVFDAEETECPFCGECSEHAEPLDVDIDFSQGIYDE